MNFSLQFEVSGDETSVSVPEITIEPQETFENPKKLKPEKQKKSSRKNPTKNLQNKDNIIDFESFRKPN